MSDDVDEVFPPEPEDPQVTLLRTTNARLSKQLEELRASRAEVVGAVYQAVSDTMQGLDLKSVPKPKLDRRRKTPEVACVGIGDWQLGKVTPDYNSEVCEERIERLAEKVKLIADIQRSDHPVKECHVWAHGDFLEGELIFPGQAHKIDAGLYRQLCVNGTRIFTNLLKSLLSHFETVKVVGTIGNHGSIGGKFRKEMDPETNADRMLYKIVQYGFECAKEPRISWDIPDGPRERHWYAVDTIGTHRTLVVHGDQIRGWGGIPWYGANKKALGWKVGGIPEDFDDVISGHFHTPAKITINSITYRFTGSPESYNTYASEHLAAAGRPSQHLQFVHPEKRVTAEHTIWLDEN